MKRIHIIGGKNHGKTTLVSDLVVEFRRLGLQVGTIKHTHHHHELDTPGKDSHRHRESGASVVGILSRSMNAIFWPNKEEPETKRSPRTEERYATFAPAFASCDLVIVEGDTQTEAPKIEVWRDAMGTSPKADQLKNVRAIITDDVGTYSLPTVPRTDVPAITRLILQILEIPSEPLTDNEINCDNQSGNHNPDMKTVF
ncbi:MAG: molybdopterin-guanine dinucleotide biosynthesis protein B [Gimesia sp.]